MDTHLKERLVGAAVLVAAAVILIPEMLSGPSDRKTEGAEGERAAQDGGVKTYTIDLGARARSGANEAVPAEAGPADVAETAAPPPETPPEEIAPAAPEPDRELVAKAPPAAPPPDPQPVDKPATTKAAQAAPSPAPAPEAPAASRPAGQAQPWVVQVGSFARQATADKLSQDLKRRGYASFVVPFKTGAQTLYRVRVGPMKERGEADAIAQKLKRDGTAATVVANG